MDTSKDDPNTRTLSASKAMAALAVQTKGFSLFAHIAKVQAKPMAEAITEGISITTAILGGTKYKSAPTYNPTAGKGMLATGHVPSHVLEELQRWWTAYANNEELFYRKTNFRPVLDFTQGSPWTNKYLYEYRRKYGDTVLLPGRIVLQHEFLRTLPAGEQ